MEESEKRELLERLEREKASRLQQETLISKLKKEQSELRKKLARAEGHIDKMRFGANVEIKEHYILTHQTRQNVTLQQGLQAQDNSTKEEGTMVGSPGRELKHVATGESTSVEEGPRQELTQEELGSGEDMNSTVPTRSACAGTHAAMDHFPRSDDQWVEKLSPIESPVPLSPKSEVLTPRSNLLDSNQSSDGNASFWLADVTPPSCDLDSSEDGDVELAREAIRKESAILSDVYDIFGSLDEYEKSRTGQSNAEGLNMVDGDEQLALTRIVNELASDEDKFDRPSDNMEGRSSPRYKTLQGMGASNKGVHLLNNDKSISSEVTSESLVDLEQLSLENRQLKNPEGPMSMQLSKGSKLKPPQVRSFPVEKLPSRNGTPAGSGRSSGHEQRGGVQPKPEQRGGVQPKPVFHSRIPRPIKKSSGLSHSRTTETVSRRNPQPISESVTADCLDTGTSDTVMVSGNTSATSGMAKDSVIGKPERCGHYELLKFKPSANEDTKSCTSSSDLTDRTTIYKLSNKSSASAQTESKGRTTSPLTSPVRFTTLPDKISRQTSTVSLERSRSNISSVSTSSGRVKQNTSSPHGPPTLLQGLEGAEKPNSGDEHQGCASNNSESLPRRIRLQPVLPLNPDSAYNTMICSSEEEYGPRDKQIQCEMQNGGTHDSSNGIYISSMGLPSTQASSIYMSYCSFHNSKILAGGEPVFAQAGEERGFCATCQNKTAPVQGTDGNRNLNIMETGGFHSGEMTSDVGNISTSQCSSPKHHVEQQDTGCSLCGGSKSLLEQCSIEPSQVGSSQSTRSARTVIPPLGAPSLKICDKKQVEKLNSTSQLTDTNYSSTSQYSPLHACSTHYSTVTSHTTGDSNLGAFTGVDDMPPMTSFQSIPRSNVKRPRVLHGEPVLNSDYLDSLKKELKKLRAQVAKAERSQVDLGSSSTPRSLSSSLNTVNADVGEQSGTNFPASSCSSATDCHSVQGQSAHGTKNYKSSGINSGTMMLSVMGTHNSYTPSYHSSIGHHSSISYSNGTSASPVGSSEVNEDDYLPMNSNHHILSPSLNSSHGGNGSLSSLAHSGKTSLLLQDTRNLKSSPEYQNSRSCHPPSNKSSTLLHSSAVPVSYTAASVDKLGMESECSLNTPVRSPMHTGIMHTFTNTTPMGTSARSSVDYTPLRIQVLPSCHSLDRTFATEASPQHGGGMAVLWSDGHSPTLGSGVPVPSSSSLSKDDLSSSSLVSMSSYQQRKLSVHPQWSPSSGIQSKCSRESSSTVSILSSSSNQAVTSYKIKSDNHAGVTTPVRSATQIELANQIGSTSQTVESSSQFGSSSQTMESASSIGTTSQTVKSPSQIRSVTQMESNGQIGSTNQTELNEIKSNSQISLTSQREPKIQMGSASQMRANNQIESVNLMGPGSQMGSISLIGSTSQMGSSSLMGSITKTGSSSLMGFDSHTGSNGHTGSNSYVEPRKQMISRNQSEQAMSQSISTGQLGSNSDIRSNSQVLLTSQMGSSTHMRNQEESTSQIGSSNQNKPIIQVESSSQVESSNQIESSSLIGSNSQVGSTLQIVTVPVGSSSQMDSTTQLKSNSQLGSNSPYFPMQCTSLPSSLSGGSHAALQSSVESHQNSPSFQTAIPQSSAQVLTPEETMSVPNSDNSFMNSVLNSDEVVSAPPVSGSPKEINSTSAKSGCSVVYHQVEHFTPIYPGIVSETVYPVINSLNSSTGNRFSLIQQAPDSSNLSVPTNANTPKSNSDSVLLPVNDLQLLSTLNSPVSSPAKWSEGPLSSAPIQSDPETFEIATRVQHQNNSPYLKNNGPAYSNLLLCDLNSENCSESEARILSQENSMQMHLQSTANEISIKSEQRDFPQLHNSCVPVSDTSGVVSSISRGPKLPIRSSNHSSNTTPSHWSSKNISLRTVCSPVNPNSAGYNCESPYSSTSSKASINQSNTSSICTPVKTDPQGYVSESVQQEAATESFIPSLETRREVQEVPSRYSLHTPLNSDSCLASTSTSSSWAKPLTQSQDTLHNFSPLSSTPLYKLHTRSVKQSDASSEGNRKLLMSSQSQSPVTISPLSHHKESVRASNSLLSDFQYSLLKNNSELDDGDGEFVHDSSLSASSKLGPPLIGSEPQDSTLENSVTNNCYSGHSSSFGQFLGEQSNEEDEEQLLQSDNSNQDELDDFKGSKEVSEKSEEHLSDAVGHSNEESAAFEPTFDSGTYSITSHCDIDDALTSPTFSLRRSSRFLVSDAPIGSVVEDVSYTPSSSRNFHAYDKISRSSAEGGDRTSSRRDNLRRKSYGYTTATLTNSFDNEQSGVALDSKSTPLRSPNDFHKSKSPTIFPVHSSHGTLSSRRDSHLVTPLREPITTDIKRRVSKTHSRQPISHNEPGPTDHSAASNRNSSGSTALWLPRPKLANSLRKSVRGNTLPAANHGRTTVPHADPINSPSHLYDHYHSIRRNYPLTSSEYGNSSSYTRRHSQSSTSPDYTATSTRLHGNSLYPNYQSYDASNSHYSPICQGEGFLASLPAERDTRSSTSQHPYYRASPQHLDRDVQTPSPQKSSTRRGRSPRRGSRYIHGIRQGRRHSLQGSEQSPDIDLQPSLLMAFNLHLRSKRMQIDLLRDLQRYENQKRNSHRHSFITHHNPHAVHSTHQSYAQSKPSSFHCSSRH